VKLLALLGSVVFMVLFIQALVEMPDGVEDSRIQELLAPLERADTIRSLFGEVILLLLTLCFFLGVSDRTDQTA
jgi:hypothetical protein